MHFNLDFEKFRFVLRLKIDVQEDCSHFCNTGPKDCTMTEVCTVMHRSCVAGGSETGDVSTDRQMAIRITSFRISGALLYYHIL